MVRILAAACTLLVAGQAWGWDGQRSGFTACLALGPTVGRAAARGGLGDWQVGAGGFFSVGFGFSNTFELGVFDTLAITASQQGKPTAHGAIGAIALGHLAATSPSFLIGGGLAILGYGAPTSDGLDATAGVGLLGVLGYELRPHWGVQLTVLYGSEPPGHGNTSFVAPMLAVFARGY